MPEKKIQDKSQFSFGKILKNKWYHVKVHTAEEVWFELYSGHTIGFHPQTQKLGLLSREIASVCFLYFWVFVCNNFSQAF